MNDSLVKTSLISLLDESALFESLK